jgi:hypothetical protein
MKARGPIFLVMYFLVHFASAQELIQGMVADSTTFSPLPYVNVILKNKNRGTISDTQGKFRLVAATSDTLVFSFVGYKIVEIPMADWEEGIVLLPEQPTMLRTLTIEDQRLDPYGDMFEEENELWRERNRKLPFYYRRSKKQKILIGRLSVENQRVKTYVDVIIQNEDTKNRLMATHALSEKEYYDLLAAFNAKHHAVMYYLTAGELISLVNNFFAAELQKRN